MEAGKRALCSSLAPMRMAPDPGWRLSPLPQVQRHCCALLSKTWDSAPNCLLGGACPAHSMHLETQGAARREPDLCGIIGAPAEIQLQHGMACTVRLGVSCVTVTSARCAGGVHARAGAGTQRM